MTGRGGEGEGAWSDKLYLYFTKKYAKNFANKYGRDTFGFGLRNIGQNGFVRCLPPR